MDLSGLFGAVAKGAAKSNPWTAAISAGVPLVGSLLSGIFGNKAQNKTNEMNLQIARENNAAQMAIAERNNALQWQALQENNRFNRNMALEMFNLENAYNLPSEQLKRLKDAGLNPNLMYGASVAGNADASTPSAASSGISPSMPSLSTPTMQTPPPVISGMFGALEQFSRTLSNVSNSDLASAQKERISALLGKEYDKLVQDVNNAELENAWNKFKFGLDQANLGRKQEQEIQELISKVFKNYADGGASHALVALREMETRLSESNFKMNEEQRPVLLENLHKLGDVYDEQAETERSKQDMNRSAARASDAQARFTNEQASQLEEMRDDNLRIKKNEATMSSAEKQFQLRTLGSRIRSFIQGNSNNLNLQQAQLDKIYKDLDYVQQLIEKADKDNKTYYYRLASDELNNIMSQISTNASTAAKFLKY